MMGRREDGQGQFFYEFNLDAVLDLSWVHKELAPYCSHTGRPSIDPVLMMRMLIGASALRCRSIWPIV